MEVVKNEIFYHIQRLGEGRTPWQLGQQYEIGKRKNPYFAFYDTFSASGRDPEVISKEYYNFAKEVIFEEIRLKNFKEYPSRYKCIWMIPNSINLQKSVHYWLRQLITMENGAAGFIIWGLSCTGIVHYANDLFYLNDNWGSLNDLRVLATKYWQGVDASPEFVNTEVLFEGNLVVNHVYNLL